MVYRETFLQIQPRLLQHLIRRKWIHGFQAHQNRFTHQRRRRMRIKHQFSIRDASPDRQPKIHLSLVREFLQRIMGQTNNDFRFRIFISTNSTHQQHLLVGSFDSRLRYVLVHNFLRNLCIGSKKRRWLIQWMIQCPRHLWEEFKCRILKYTMRGLLQHWTESSIILTSKRRISLEEQNAHKEDRFLRGRQIAFLIYEYFRVTGANDSVENYADLFTNGLRNDDIQEFDSKRNGILLSMTKIPPDDILEGLYKLRIRESEKLKTVLELYNQEIHQKKIGPDYHRLITMVERSIEQDLRK